MDQHKPFSTFLGLVLILLLQEFVLANNICVEGSSPVIAVQFGQGQSSLNENVKTRVLNLIHSAAQYPVVEYDYNVDLRDKLAPGSMVLSFGNTTSTNLLIERKSVESLGSEGLVVRADEWKLSCSDEMEDNILVVATDGNSLVPDPFLVGGCNGLNYGTYTLLEEVGFAFPHPLQPIIPKELALRKPIADHKSDKYLLNIETKPRWPQRGTHYHSEHPLEFHEVLNGFGLNASQKFEDWEALVPELPYLAEWLVSHRQNRLEWVLLYATDWKDFAQSSDRRNRLHTITKLFESWGIATGADVSIAERQQHAWYMSTMEGTLESEVKEIHDRLFWLLSDTGAGFHFLSTENGFTEFTHPGEERMLALINATATIATVNSTELYGRPKRAYIKCHCSTHQVCSTYKDPRTGELLNFNFLPMLAVPEMGVYPHTVQFYTFNDPAPTYGNSNFTYMLEFLEYEGRKGEREVLFHGETAYWVDYDVNVPLFLPIYGDARLQDFRLIAESEAKHGYSIQGSMNFHSGLEWGYWLNDVINFAAAWDPHPELSLDDVRQLFYGRFARWFESNSVSTPLQDLLIDYVKVEHDLLVLGKYKGSDTNSVVRRNGQGYIEGWDMSSEIGVLFSKRAAVQPDRLGLLEARDPLSSPSYEKEIQPLLEAMESEFCALAGRFQALGQICGADDCADGTSIILDELTNSANITCMRATQVHGLYDYAAGWMKAEDWREERLKAAENALNTATLICQSQREILRAKPIDRLIGWRKTPTVYNYGYLWETNSLYYFWRDYGKAILKNPEAIVPCYLNIYNIVDVAIGEGVVLNLTEAIRNLFDEIKWDVKYLVDCLAEPKNEYHFPHDL